MDAASLFSSANALYVKEEYEEALKHYTCAVTLQDCAEHRVCRAAAYLRLGKFEEVLDDAKQALALDPKSHMALHWRGIALFYMGDYGGAKAAFEESLQIAPSARAPRAVWIRKCDAELSGSTLPLGGVATQVAKTVPVAASAGAPPVAAASSAAPAAPVSTVSEARQASGKASTELTISGRKPVKREWYQNNTHVFITLFAKGVEQSQCEVDFKENEMSLSFPLPNSAEETAYSEDLELFAAINPSGCSYEVSSMKVEIKLAKKDVGLQWKDLEKQEAPPEMPTHQPDQPAYPTSNKAKRDWSQIDRDIDAELKNEKPEGDEALNKLFKEIYERADDETRRAMNKSFQTSGGTVLSTNWGEVARADYEGKDRPTPPEGQQWEDWRKK